MHNASALLALIFLAYCLSAQFAALYLTKKAISATKKQNLTVPSSEIPKAKFGSYRNQLRWLKTNFINLSSQTQQSVRAIKTIEKSIWLSMAVAFSLYLTANLKG